MVAECEGVRTYGLQNESEPVSIGFNGYSFLALQAGNPVNSVENLTLTEDGKITCSRVLPAEENQPALSQS